MLLMINLIIFGANVWADDAFNKELLDFQKNFNPEDLMKGVDHDNNVIDVREQANQEIDPEIFGASKKEVQNTLDNAADKPLHELENKGRAAGLENPEVTGFLDELDRNANDATPGVSKIKEDVEKIAKQRAAIDKNLSQYLKEEYEIDLDCTSIPGKAHNMQDDFIVGIEEEEVRDEVYEPQYCEHLLNTYDCTTDLHLECLKKGSRPVNLSIVSHNGFRHHQKDNNIHIDHGYEGNVDKDYEDGSWDTSDQSYTYYRLATADLKLVFNIPFDPKVLHELALTNVHFSHAIFIKLNGHNVYPADWNDLRRETTISWHGGPSTAQNKVLRKEKGGTKYWDFLPYVNHGTGTICLDSDGNHNHHLGHIDLKPFAKQGHNELIIKGASIKASHIIMDLHSLERKCLKWSEKWVETCVLRAS